MVSPYHTVGRCLYRVLRFKTRQNSNRKLAMTTNLLPQFSHSLDQNKRPTAFSRFLPISFILAPETAAEYFASGVFSACANAGTVILRKPASRALAAEWISLLPGAKLTQQGSKGRVGTGCPRPSIARLPRLFSDLPRHRAVNDMSPWGRGRGRSFERERESFLLRHRFLSRP